ncbi:MAG TPA: energy transducer TonB [Pyrinomonadaceae bacterium]
MFSNLIESGSHAADLKRKGRFFLGATLFYGLLLATAGVGSIYAYNARLDYTPEYEVLTLMRFPAAEARAARPRREQTRAAAGGPSRATPIPTRVEISMNTPYAGRVAKADTPETRPGQAVRLGDFNSRELAAAGSPGPYTPGVPGERGGEGGDRGPAVTPDVEPPPARATPTPAPTPRQKTGPVSLPSSVISSKVVDKPAPPYPPIAKAAGLQGAVAVQIVVDEQGRVISARATSGNPLLQQAAVQAAYRARFTPTLLTGQPVKVTGSITYNFVLR